MMVCYGKDCMMGKKRQLETIKALSEELVDKAELQPLGKLKCSQDYMEALLSRYQYCYRKKIPTTDPRWNIFSGRLLRQYSLTYGAGPAFVHLHECVSCCSQLLKCRARVVVSRKKVQSAKQRLRDHREFFLSVVK